MLTALLRSKTPLGFLLALILALAMLVFQFFWGKGEPDVLLFTHWALEWLKYSGSTVPFISLALAIIVLFVARIRFREVNTTLGSVNLTTVALVSILTVQSRSLFTRPDVIVALLALIGVFMLLFFTYKRNSVLSEVFHIGLLLGLASLFVGQCILLLIAVVFSLLTLRTGSWKEWTVLFLGVVMVVVFVALILVWYQSPFLAFERMIQTSWTGSFQTGRLTAGHLLLFIPVLMSLSSVFRDLTIGTVHERNITIANISWLLGVLLMVLILGLGWQVGFILAAFPLSTFIARSIQELNRWWLADLLLVTLIAAPFFSNLWQL